MAYTDETALDAEFGADEVLRCADRDGDDVVDVVDGIDVVTRNCTLAQGVCEGYLGKYKLPLDPVPGSVRDAATSIAMYRLSSWSDTLTDDKRKRFEDAISWLKDVAAGKAALVDDGVEPELKVKAPIRMSAEPREFTRSKLGGIL